MGKNLAPRVKRQRRIGEKLFTHGEKSFSRRPYPPGQHGPKGSSKLSEYGVRLREKQKAQMTYGLLERQFRTYVAKAKRKTGNTVELLLQLLELRLDNIVFRAGFAKSREGARQLIRHGHIAVNGRRVDIPSFQAKVHDAVALHENSRSKSVVQIITKEIENYEAPPWIALDTTSLIATVREIPALNASATNINLQRIVEFYSR